MLLTPLLFLAAACSQSTPAAAAPALPDAAALAKVDDEPARASRGGPSGKLSATPPNTAHVPAVPRARIGSSLEGIMPLISTQHQFAPAFVAEMPLHTMRVEEFHLGLTEVTNEQYLAFVEATGHRPPVSWDGGAINAALLAFNQEQGRRIQEAREAGRPMPAAGSFDRWSWWDRNWREVEWAMPPELAALPVVYVDHRDAEAYARWAGMRLMTEFEFQAAGRGDRDQPFVWGSEWVGANAVTSVERAQRGAQPVGSRPGGATSHGIHDLLGNVWEWTASPYVAYPGFREQSINVGDRRNPRILEPKPQWSADRRVVVGGSLHDQSRATVRLTTRRPTDRNQRADAVGFRVAASVQPGADLAAQLVNEVGPGSLGDGVPIAERTLAVDRWYTSPGKAEVEGYALVEGYEAVAVVPIERMPFNNSSELLNHTLREGPAHFGLLHTSLPLAKPALEPGTYVLAYRSPGRSRARGAADEENGNGEELTGVEALIDPAGPNLVAFDLRGAPVIAWRTSEARYENPDRQRPQGSLGMTVADGDEGTDLLHVVLPVPARAGTRAFHFDIQLEFAPRALAGPWRR